MMRRPWIALIVVGLAYAVATGRGQSASTDTPNLSGVWTLNRDQSDNPEHAGFVEGPAPQGGRAPLGGTGFGGGQPPLDTGGGNDGPSFPKDIQRRIDELTNEVRNPSPLLTITQAGAELTIVDFQGRMRAFHMTGKKETQRLSSGMVDSTTRWDGTRLITEYNVTSARKVSYTYTVLAGEKPQLLVLVKFEGGRRSNPVIRQVYEGSPRP